MKKQSLITPFSTRQYMFSKDYEIYYYSDTNPLPVSDHTHNYYEFYFFLEGNISMTINNKSYAVKPGDFIIIPPQIHHHPIFLDNVTPYRRFVLWISKSFFNSLINSSPDYGYFNTLIAQTDNYRFSLDVVQFNEIQSQLFTIAGEIKGNRLGRDPYVFLMISSLIITLNRMLYEQFESNPDSGRLSASINSYILSHIEEDLSLEKLEQIFFVSKYHIEHIFKEDYGISIHKFIRMKRLYLCRDAIKSGTPIQDACTLYGFNNYSVFFRAFKNEFGLSPRDYQKK